MPRFQPPQSARWTQENFKNMRSTNGKGNAKPKNEWGKQGTKVTRDSTREQNKGTEETMNQARNQQRHKAMEKIKSIHREQT